MHKRIGPIDRVDDPASSGTTSRFAFLFSQHAIVGKLFRNRTTQIAFRLTVRDRHKTAISFGIRLRFLAIVLECDLPGLTGDLHGEFKYIVEFSCLNGPYPP